MKKFDEAFNTEFRLGVPLIGDSRIDKRSGGFSFTTSEASEKSALKLMADKIAVMEIGTGGEHSLFVITREDMSPFTTLKKKRKKYYIYESMSIARNMVKSLGSKFEEKLIVTEYTSTGAYRKSKGRNKKVYTIDDGFTKISGNLFELNKEFGTNKKNIRSLVSHLGLAYNLVNEAYEPITSMSRVDEERKHLDFRLGLAMIKGKPVLKSKGQKAFTTSKSSEQSMIRTLADEIIAYKPKGEVTSAKSPNSIYVISYGGGTVYFKVVQKNIRGRKVNKTKFYIFFDFNKAKMSLKLLHNDELAIVEYLPEKEIKTESVKKVNDKFEVVEGGISNDVQKILFSRVLSNADTFKNRFLSEIQEESTKPIKPVHSISRKRFEKALGIYFELDESYDFTDDNGLTYVDIYKPNYRYRYIFRKAIINVYENEGKTVVNMRIYKEGDELGRQKIEHVLDPDHQLPNKKVSKKKIVSTQSQFNVGHIIEKLTVGKELFDMVLDIAEKGNKNSKVFKGLNKWLDSGKAKEMMKLTMMFERKVNNYDDQLSDIIKSWSK